MVRFAACVDRLRHWLLFPVHFVTRLSICVFFLVVVVIPLAPAALGAFALSVFFLSNACLQFDKDNNRLASFGLSLACLVGVAGLPVFMVLYATLLATLDLLLVVCDAMTTAKCHRRILAQFAKLTLLQSFFEGGDMLGIVDIPSLAIMGWCAGHGKWWPAHILFYICGVRPLKGHLDVAVKRGDSWMVQGLLNMDATLDKSNALKYLVHAPSLHVRMDCFRSLVFTERGCYHEKEANIEEIAKLSREKKLEMTVHDLSQLALALDHHQMAKWKRKVVPEEVLAPVIQRSVDDLFRRLNFKANANPKSDGDKFLRGLEKLLKEHSTVTSTKKSEGQLENRQEILYSYIKDKQIRDLVKLDWAEDGKWKKLVDRRAMSLASQFCDKTDLVEVKDAFKANFSWLVTDKLYRKRWLQVSHRTEFAVRLQSLLTLPFRLVVCMFLCVGAVGFMALALKSIPYKSKICITLALSILKIPIDCVVIAVSCLLAPLFGSRFMGELESLGLLFIFSIDSKGFISKILLWLCGPAHVRPFSLNLKETFGENATDLGNRRSIRSLLHSMPPSADRTSLFNSYFLGPRALETILCSNPTPIMSPESDGSSFRRYAKVENMINKLEQTSGAGAEYTLNVVIDGGAKILSFPVLVARDPDSLEGQLFAERRGAKSEGPNPADESGEEPKPRKILVKRLGPLKWTSHLLWGDLGLLEKKKLEDEGYSGVLLYSNSNDDDDPPVWRSWTDPGDDYDSPLGVGTLRTKDGRRLVELLKSNPSSCVTFSIAPNDHKEWLCRLDRVQRVGWLSRDDFCQRVARRAYNEGNAELVKLLFEENKEWEITHKATSTSEMGLAIPRQYKVSNLDNWKTAFKATSDIGSDDWFAKEGWPWLIKNAPLDVLEAAMELRPACTEARVPLLERDPNEANAPEIVRKICKHGFSPMMPSVEVWKQAGLRAAAAEKGKRGWMFPRLLALKETAHDRFNELLPRPDIQGKSEEWRNLLQGLGLVEESVTLFENILTLSDLTYNYEALAALQELAIAPASMLGKKLSDMVAAAKGAEAAKAAATASDVQIHLDDSSKCRLIARVIAMMLRLLLPDTFVIDCVGGGSDAELDLDEKARIQYSIRATIEPTMAKCFLKPNESQSVDINISTKDREALDDKFIELPTVGPIDSLMLSKESWAKAREAACIIAEKHMALKRPKDMPGFLLNGNHADNATEMADFAIVPLPYKTIQSEFYEAEDIPCAARLLALGLRARSKNKAVHIDVNNKPEKRLSITQNCHHVIFLLKKDDALFEDHIALLQLAVAHRQKSKLSLVPYYPNAVVDQLENYEKVNTEQCLPKEGFVEIVKEMFASSDVQELSKQFNLLPVDVSFAISHAFAGKITGSDFKDDKEHWGWTAKRFWDLYDDKQIPEQVLTDMDDEPIFVRREEISEEEDGGEDEEDEQEEDEQSPSGSERSSEEAAEALDIAEVETAISGMSIGGSVPKKKTSLGGSQKSLGTGTQSSSSHAKEQFSEV